MFHVVSWVTARYNRPAIIITESGCDMLGEDEPRRFDAALFSAYSSSGGGVFEAHDVDEDEDGVQSLESMLRSESEDTKSLLVDEFRQVWKEECNHACLIAVTAILTKVKLIT
jgi:hypothetical protein